MKHTMMILSLMTLAMFGSCVKAKKTKIQLDTLNVNEILKSKFSFSGFKCEITGKNESKDVFLRVTTKDSKRTLHFYDYTSATVVTLAGLKFEDYSILSLSLDSSTNKGAGIMFGTEENKVLDEGKVVSISSEVNLDENFEGTIAQRFIVLKDDNSMITVSNKEFAVLSRCERASASTL